MAAALINNPTLLTTNELTALWPNDPNRDILEGLMDRLNDILQRLENKTINRVQDRQGAWHGRLQFYSSQDARGDVNLHSRVYRAYRQYPDFGLAERIARCYYDVTGDCRADLLGYFADKIVKYVNFLGDNCEIFEQVFTRRITRSQSFSPEEKETLTRLCSAFTRSLSRQLVPFPQRSLLIGFSSSGGAHKSIKDAIQARFRLRDKPLDVEAKDETTLCDDEAYPDPLKRCVGIAYSRCYSEIEQKLAYPEYSNKLRRLDGLLSDFIRSQCHRRLKEETGDTRNFISTSHHDYDVRLLTERVERLYFQICDFGNVNGKLRELVRIVTKYDVKQITFFAPSEHTYCEIKEGKYHWRLIGEEGNAPSAFRQRVLMRGYPVNMQVTMPGPINSEEIHHITTTYNIDYGPDIKLVIMVMGLQGVGNIIQEYIRQFIEGYRAAHSSRNFCFLVVCGDNKEMKKDLGEFVSSQRDLPNVKFSIQGTVKNRDLMILGKMSHAYVTKPGGASIAEGIYGAFPLLIHRNGGSHWEEGNIIEATTHARIGRILSPQNFYGDLMLTVDQESRQPRDYPNPDIIHHIAEELNL